MTMRFGWVDVSEADRQRMLDVLKAFGDQDTRDELGLGSVRDAFANHFFPGTSTIQTRARYMLFVPWIYLALERKGVASSRIARRARDDEIRLIHALLQSEDHAGLIGQEAKGKLQRLPSAIYWSGLGSWGIRRYPGSQDQYHRLVDVLAARSKAAQYDDDGQPVDAAARVSWDPGLPPAPAGLLQKAELALTREEALYLRERVLLSHPQSLLAHVLLADQNVDVPYVWEHPVIGTLPDRLEEEVRHGRHFSEAMHGAPLLYNWMLAASLESENRLEYYRQALQVWLELLVQGAGALRRWHQDLDGFWDCRPLLDARISPATRRFVGEWLEQAFGVRDVSDLLSNQLARKLVHDREVRLKGARSRLGNRRQLELWSGAAGTLRLDYRWSTARSLCADISTGLTREVS